MSVKCLIYCSKAKPNLYRPFEYDCFEQDETSGFYLSNNPMLKEDILLNGKIVASFDCKKVDKIIATKWSVGCGLNYYEFETKDLFEKSYLRWIDLTDYLQDQNGYAIHISNLEIFDEPKELAKHTLDNNSDFYIKKWIKKFDSFKGSALTKAPQNMCNVYDRFCNHYVLISIIPEWVAKILNGEKTIEVRKKVVNKLKELI